VLREKIVKLLIMTTECLKVRMRCSAVNKCMCLSVELDHFLSTTYMHPTGCLSGDLAEKIAGQENFS
jgi:hypothetical protein